MFQLREYQRYTVRRAVREATLNKKIRFLLADDMGTGKSAQVISVVKAVIGGVDPLWGDIILVTTKSTIWQWAAEINKVWPDNGLPITIITSAVPPGERQAMLDSALCGWILTTYQMLKVLDFSKRKQQFNIVDECHHVKNRKAKQSQHLYKKLIAPHRIPMGGTPYDKPHELWHMASWLFPEAFPYTEKSYHAFAHRYGEFISVPGLNGTLLYRGPRNEKEFHEFISKFVIRRQKRDKDVLAHLPSLIKENVTIHLSKSQKIIIEKMRKGLILLDSLPNGAEIGTADHKTPYFQNKDGEILLTVEGAMALAIREMQVGVCPSVIGLKAGDAPKLEYIADEIEKARNPIIVFSQFTGCLDAAQRYLQDVKKHGKPLRVLRIDGSVKAQVRTQICDKVNTGQCDVLLLSMAGREGINLYGADRMIFLTTDPSSIALDQLIGRIERSGQINPMRVTYLQSSNIDRKSLECASDKLANNRRALAQAFAKAMGFRGVV